jgi:hypothetical protein
MRSTLRASACRLPPSARTMRPFERRLATS